MPNLPPATLALLDAKRHKPPLVDERRRVLVEKVARTSAVLSALTLLWVMVDYLTLPGLAFYWLLFCRLVACLVLLGLHRLCVGRVLSGPAAVGSLLLVPVLFLAAASLVFAMSGSAAAPAAGSDAYRNSPFLLAVGLSLFPLTVAEVGAAAVPILLLMLVQIACGPNAGDPLRETAALWRLAVMIGIAGISSVSQLRVLLDITRRATLDLLTGVFTRQAGEHYLTREFSLAERTGMPLAVLFVDLDRFKRVNDGYGHDAGDTVLRNAARTLATAMRKHDVVIRWGGEEFLVVLPDTSADAAAGLVERFGAAGLGRRPDGAPQSASIGVAERFADQAADWASLVEAADRRMYAAKQSGRNCWVDCRDVVHPFALHRQGDQVSGGRTRQLD